MSLFGNTATGGGLFGNQQTNQQNTGTNLFGGASNQTTNTGTNLFGNTNQQNTGNTTQGTGLFGQTNNQQNSGTNLFGNTNTGGGLFSNTNTNQQNNTTGGGLFGNTTNTNTTTGGGLFSNTTTNSGGGLFGNTNQQNNKGTGLFGNTTTNANTGGGLFSNTNQGGGLFGSSQNKTTTIFGNSNTNNQSTSLFGTTVFTPSNQQNQPYSTLNTYPSKRDMDIYEVQLLFQTIVNAYNPSSPSNLFKYFLYTKIPYGTDGRVYNQYSPYVRSEDGTTNCIDYNLWLKATQDNKNPQTTFPTQISSPKQFVSRLKMNEVQLLSVLEEIVKMQKNLESLNIKCGNEIDTELYNAREKMKKIKNLLTIVSTKMAKLGIRTGKVDKNVAIEKKIEEKLVHITSFTNEGSEINRKINMLRNASLENTTIEQDESNYMKDMNKIRIDRNINVLRQMKQIIDSQFSNLNKNIKIINGIQNDLNQLSRYGKIK